jgi:hypothetical protein
MPSTTRISTLTPGFLSSLPQEDDDPMNVISVYRYYQDTTGRLKVWNQELPFFPKDLVTMKSGHGFHESCHEVYVNAWYRKGLMKKKYSKEEADQMIPPPLWEYTRSPWYFGLAVKNRRDPQLAMQVADVMNNKTNLPISHAEMKRQKQVGNAVAKV